MEMLYYQSARSSYQETQKLLEADIQHANALAAVLPSSKNGARLQMKYLDLFHVLIYKVYKDGRPTISTRGRKATVRDFYAIILPSLRRLHGDVKYLDIMKDEAVSMVLSRKKRLEEDTKSPNADFEREAECGICLEPCSKVVLPNCCHEMCINCYRDWNTRSESCPFCRGTLKRVKSEDLWVLTCTGDVVDPETATKQDLFHFYVYINSLPKDSPDVLFFLYYEYLM